MNDSKYKGHQVVRSVAKKMKQDKGRGQRCYFREGSQERLPLNWHLKEVSV